MTRYAQAALGLVGLSGVATTAAGTAAHDNKTAILGAAATFFGFLMHRHLAMRDVQRVVSASVSKAVFDVAKQLEAQIGKKLQDHEDHCKWVLRPSQSLPPSDAE